MRALRRPRRAARTAPRRPPRGAVRRRARGGRRRSGRARTAFHAGSIAKPLAATLALDAAARGELDLGAPGPGGWDDPLRALIGHTSGRPTCCPTTASRSRRSSRAWARWVTPPGRFAYCNAGWAVVDLALEAATGLGFEALAGERVLGPLGTPRGSRRLPGMPSRTRAATRSRPPREPRVLGRGQPLVGHGGRAARLRGAAPARGRRDHRARRDRRPARAARRDPRPHGRRRVGLRLGALGPRRAPRARVERLHRRPSRLPARFRSRTPHSCCSPTPPVRCSAIARCMRSFCSRRSTMWVTAGKVTAKVLATSPM